MAQIALPLMAVSAALSASNTLASGTAELGAARFKANEFRQQAGQTRASSTVMANNERTQADYVASRAKALAAASGAGATDPTTLDVISNIQGRGEYNALSALYSGEERARGLENQANLSVYEGQQAKKASQIKAASTLIGSAGSMFDKYGGGNNPTNYDTPATTGYDDPTQKRRNYEGYA